MKQDRLTLSELNNYIEQIVDNEFPKSIWVVGEISELNVNSRGHCYIDFIEKDPLTNKIIARQRATIWAFQFRLIKAHFENVTRQSLQAGLKVLVSANVKYHALYGLSLNIVDIDTSFTIGEQQKQKEQVIQQLIDEGVFNMNKQLEMPTVAMNIALISSETAAGYGDFINHIEQFSTSYNINVKLFQASMQGENAPKEIVDAIENIFNDTCEFDLIVIIRGGGAKSELATFDNYDIAYMITQIPIPVISGIGHERDQSVVDMVAYKSLKTPTAVAEFILQKVVDLETKLDELYNELQLLSKSILQDYKNQLEQNYKKLKESSQKHINNQLHRVELLDNAKNSIAFNYLNQHKNALDVFKQKIKSAISNKIDKSFDLLDYKQNQLKYRTKVFIDKRYTEIDILQQRIEINNPVNQLERGFGIVTKNGKMVKHINKLSVNDEIYVRLIDGKVTAKVNKIENQSI